MWNSNSPDNKIANAMVAGALVFNSCPITEPLEQEGFSKVRESNIQNLFSDHWSSIGISVEEDIQDDNQEILGVADIVREVKIHLGLPNKDVAQIFNVTRQTLHTYLKDSEQGHVINQQTRERAHSLKAIMQKISPVFERSPGAMAKNFTVNEASLLDLMSSNDLDVEKIHELSLSLANKMDEYSKGTAPVSSSSSLSELTQHT